MDVKVYKMPTEIVMGRGASKQTGEWVKELNTKKAFIATDKGIVNAGILEGILNSLKEESIEYVLFDEVESDPSTDMIDKATELAKKSGCDFTIGIGGGSSMDTAKAVAAMVTNEGKIFDYVGIGKIKKKPLPIVAIPTTAGTGSEATYWSVITDKKTNIKTGVGSWYLMPTIAIVDPLLTKSMPPRVTAFTGMDALTHAVESYVCKATQPISESLAIHSIKLIARSLRKAVADGDNIDAREDMIMGSTLAALAFNVTRLGLAHAIASPLGAHFNIPHGVANAIVLPNVMEFNVLAVPEKFAEIAIVFGEDIKGLSEMEAGMKAVDAVKKLMRDIGIIEGLKDYGLKEEDLKTIAEEAYKSGNVTVNPRKTTVNDLIEIMKKSMNGLK
jgi:alcohol dehydrogenase